MRVNEGTRVTSVALVPHDEAEDAEDTTEEYDTIPCWAACGIQVAHRHIIRF